MASTIRRRAQAIVGIVSSSSGDCRFMATVQLTILCLFGPGSGLDGCCIPIHIAGLKSPVVTTALALQPLRVRSFLSDTVWCHYFGSYSSNHKLNACGHHLAESGCVKEHVIGGVAVVPPAGKCTPKVKTHRHKRRFLDRHAMERQSAVSPSFHWSRPSSPRSNLIPSPPQARYLTRFDLFSSQNENAQPAKHPQASVIRRDWHPATYWKSLWRRLFQSLLGAHAIIPPPK